MSFADDLEDVKQSILSHFNFLVTDLGFRVTNEMIEMPELFVRFENETTRVTVFFEIGTAPRVHVGRLSRSGSSPVESEVYELGYVRQVRKCVEPAPADFKHVISDGIRQRLREEAHSLRTCAQDLLVGNFDVFEEIRPLARQAYEEAKRKLDRTESGA